MADKKKQPSVRDDIEKSLKDKEGPNLLGALQYGFPAALAGGLIGRRIAGKARRAAEKKAFALEDDAMRTGRQLSPAEELEISRRSSDYVRREFFGTTAGAVGGTSYGATTGKKRRK